jgi:4a-hydroxytetrahydrobiopterin dehydratase
MITFEDLLHKHCVARDGTAPLPLEAIPEYRQALTRGWEITENKEMRHEFTFADFDAAMKFVEGIADVARAEDHHPDMCIRYSRVLIELSTHSAGGLTENDFILAAKIEQLAGKEIKKEV